MIQANKVTLLIALATLGACSPGSEPSLETPVSTPAAASTSVAPSGELDGAATAGDTAPATTTATTIADPTGPPTTEPDAGQDAGPDDSAPEPTIAAEPPATIPGRPTGGGPDDESSEPNETVPPPSPDEVTRVISLEATHTETLFAIGAADLLVGVDHGSDYPADAVALQGPGLASGTADVSAIEALDPDLVIVGDDVTGLAGRLTAVGIAVWRGPTPVDADAALTQIVDLAAAVGRADTGAALVDEMRDELARLRATLPADGTLTYFHEIDPGLTTVVPGTFIDSVYAALGITSIVPVDADGVAAGSTAVAADDVIAADPDVIVLADAACCAVDASVLASRPGWSDIAAVRNGAIVELPGRLPERWGPRLVQWWQLVASAATAG